MLEQFKRKRLPYGFTFLNVEETKNINKKSKLVESILTKAFYEPITPSTIDFSDTFEVFGRDDAFTLRDRLGDEISLRNDVTLQVIKGFSNQLESKFIKEDVSRYYYNVPVFKNIQKSYPTSREIRQIGAEVIGLQSEAAITELIILSDRIMKEVFKTPCKIILGNINIFNKFKKYLNEQQLGDIVLHKNTSKLSDFFYEQGLSKQDAFSLSRVLLLFESTQQLKIVFNDILGKSKKLKPFLEEMYEELLQLDKMCSVIQNKNILVEVEPLFTCKFSYYSGLMFEGYVKGISYPPLRGGSYDSMMAYYSKENLPASGFAIDITSLS